MQHILSLSYGKNSIACLGAIEQLGWPLDRIVHAEVLATDTIPADLPPMVEFKKKADQIIKERWGIEVEHVRGRLTYEQAFYRVLGGKKRPGEIYGWPIPKGPYCNSDVKMPSLDKLETKDAIIYVGIAADEPNRFHVLSAKKISPLVEAGWRDSDCREWCKKIDLLSPTYATSNRGGCWFCPNQSVNQLRLLRKNYPDLWALMLKWDGDSPVSFRPPQKKKDGTIIPGKTIRDFDRRFELEDTGIIRPGNKFLWDYVKSKTTNGGLL